MGDDNGNGIMYFLGVVTGIFGTIMVQFLWAHLTWN